MKTKSLTFAIFALFLSLHSSAKTDNPKHLRASTSQVVYVLHEDYIFSEKAATFTLKAGQYTQRFESNTAMYLLGKNQCLSMHVLPPKNPSAQYTQPFECGIYVSKDPKKGAAFFAIRGAIASDYGLLIDAMIKYGEGSFMFPTRSKNDMELKAKLLILSEPK